MLVKKVMSVQVVCCTPWDTAKTAATLMKAHGIGAIPVVSDLGDRLLEGIVTDRDLCCRVIPNAGKGDDIRITDVMTPIPVTCNSQNTLEECQELMQENQVRRVPVVDERGRCIGIVAQADIALYAPAAEVAKTMAEISAPSKGEQNIRLERDWFYCGQTHEEDEILLLNRRRVMHRKHEVST